MSFLDSVRATVDSVRGFVDAQLVRLGLSEHSAVIGALVFIASFFGSLVVTGSILVRLPPNFLVEIEPENLAKISTKKILMRFGRHLIGVLLVLIGIVLSLPGVPGPGILTIIAGLLLSDLPGTRNLVRRIVRSPRVFSAVNVLRKRYKHPPLIAG